jgi:hypothetical protein
VLLSAKVGIGFSVFAAGAFVAAVVGPGPSNACFKLNGGKGFTITSVVTTYPACSGPTVYLYPGVQRCLVYTAHNPLAVPLTVNSLGIASVTLTTQPRDQALPPCTTAELDLSKSSFSGSLVVPALGTNSVAEPIRLIENGTNQDNCERAVFDFVYTGNATYTDTTTTALTSSPNPSRAGQTVTFVATVTPTGTPPGSPTGAVSFYLCPSANCAPATLLGSASVGTEGRASYTTASLAPGTNLVEAVYESAATDFTGSTSGTVSQVVQALRYATATVLAASPDPSALGRAVTLTATVTRSSGPGAPTGAVSFYSGNPGGSHTLLGTSNLSASGRATFATSGLLAGRDSLYAAYGGDTNFGPSTSPAITETVVAPPAPCQGTFQGLFTGAPGSPVIDGTNQDDFIYAFGGDYFINGFGGNDCIWAGDGANYITDGNGNDVLLGGDGPNVVLVGNGNDTITLGNGRADAVTAGNGNDTVTLGNGHNDVAILGNGSDSVTIGTGSYDVVTLGTGADTITVSSGGSHDTLNGGNGNETVYLGTGTYNTYNGAPHRANICHVPAPPSSWNANAASYYHDILVNCAVVSP